MNALASSTPRLVRPLLALLLALIVVTLAAGPWSSTGRAADPSAPPAASVLPSPAVDAAAAMCQSAADLRLYIGYLRERSPSEDGWLPILVGAAAAVAEARTLVGLVGETYQPLASDLRDALEALRTSIRGLRDGGTVGSRIAELGGAILAIGTSMDALATALREPCGTLAEASPIPAASPAG